MNEEFFQWYDRMGRPTLRLAGVIILTLIGLAIAVQFLAWAILNREPAEMPLQNFAVAALPYMMQMVDHITRQMQKKDEIAFGRRAPVPA